MSRTFVLRCCFYTSACANKLTTSSNMICVMSIFATLFKASLTHICVLEYRACPTLVGDLWDDLSTMFQDWALSYGLLRAVTVRWSQNSFMVQFILKPILTSCRRHGLLVRLHIWTTCTMNSSTVGVKLPRVFSLTHVAVTSNWWGWKRVSWISKRETIPRSISFAIPWAGIVQILSNLITVPFVTAFEFLLWISALFLD